MVIKSDIIAKSCCVLRTCFLVIILIFLFCHLDTIQLSIKFIARLFLKHFSFLNFVFIKNYWWQYWEIIKFKKYLLNKFHALLFNHSLPNICKQKIFFSSSKNSLLNTQLMFEPKNKEIPICIIIGWINYCSVRRTFIKNLKCVFKWHKIK